MPVPIIQPAYELAEAGDCDHLTDIKEALRKEGYDNIDAHLSGQSIRIALVKWVQGSSKA